MEQRYTEASTSISTSTSSEYKAKWHKLEGVGCWMETLDVEEWSGAARTLPKNPYQYRPISPVSAV
jgi:hypothetical protein